MSRTRDSRKLARSGERGQSTLEFALSMTLVIAFLLFFFQLSMIFAYGSYVHYATFMAARARLSAGPDPGDQDVRTRNVLAQMLKASAGSSGQDRFSMIGQAYGGGQNSDLSGVDVDPSPFDPNNKLYSWLQGVRYTFKSRLFLMPFATANPAQAFQNQGPQGQAAVGVNQVVLKSESFLGRETSDQECASGMRTQWNGLGKEAFFDNGC